MPDIQQYKGTYFLAILVSMSALFALENMKNGPSKKLRQVSKIIGAALFILVFTKLGVVEDYSLSGDCNGPQKLDTKLREYTGV